MNIDDLILVSVDDHVVEPPEMFEGHIPEKCKDRAPKVVTRDDGTDAWVFEGQEATNVGLNAVAGRPPDEYGVEPTRFSEMRPGCFDIHERIRDMNANGVLASMNFPSFPTFTARTLMSGKNAIPQTLVIAPDGHIVSHWRGYTRGQSRDRLRETIEHALSEASSGQKLQ